jgi:hypothetical protein
MGVGHDTEESAVEYLQRLYAIADHFMTVYIVKSMVV